LFRDECTRRDDRSRARELASVTTRAGYGARGGLSRKWRADAKISQLRR
jgi:hypothetical protein